LHEGNENVKLSGMQHIDLFICCVNCMFAGSTWCRCSY